MFGVAVGDSHSVGEPCRRLPLCMCVCMCVYIYIYTHIHTYIIYHVSLSLYIYIYIEREVIVHSHGACVTWGLYYNLTNYTFKTNTT